MQFVHFKYSLLLISASLCSGLIARTTQQASPTKPSFSANALLLEAAEKGDLKKAEQAIAQGANPNFTGRFGTTPLLMASAMLSEEMVKLLIDKGARVNVADDNKWTPLHFAAAHSGQERIVKLLLDKGANVNAVTNTGDTPLLKAVATFDNNQATVKLLLEHGADVNKQSNSDSFGYAPLHEANSEAMVKLLLDNGANINAQITGQFDKGYTALHLAVARANVPVVKLLLDRGANPSIKDERGETPADIAKAEGHVIIQEPQATARKKEFKKIVDLLEQHMKMPKK